MARPYRASNKRLIHRTGGGQFRRATLGDVGLGACDQCGKLFVPNLDDLASDPFVDPRVFSERRRTCGPCLGIGEPAPKPEPPSLMAKCAEWFGNAEAAPAEGGRP